MIEKIYSHLNNFRKHKKVIMIINNYQANYHLIVIA